MDNPTSFRLASPDETNSNRVGAVFEVSDRAFMELTLPSDVALSADGRVMEVLSEHNCHGWIEAYTLTGRQGLFATYEAFAMVSASMTIQHTKWLEEAHHLAWRNPVPSLNILLTSTCWRNDHNGFSHQGPDLIQNVINKRGTVSRIYFPPDANSLVVVGRPLLPHAEPRQSHRHRQAAPAAVPDARARRRPTSSGARRSGTGPATRTSATTRTWCSPPPATS